MCALRRRGGLRRARRRARLLRGLRGLADDVPALPDLADLALEALEGAGPVPLAPLPRRHVRPAGERPVRPSQRRSGLLLVGVRRRRSGRAGGKRRPGRAHRWPLRRRRLGADARSDRSGGRARRRRDRAVRAQAGAVAPELPPVPIGRAARHGRGLGEVQPALLAPRLPRLPRVLLRPADPRAALDEADRGLRPVGARGRGGVADPRGRGGAHALGERGGRPRDVRACALPRARDPRRPRQLPDARACERGRRADRWHARDHGGRRSPPASATSGAGERPAEGLRRLGRAAGAEGEDLDAGAQPAAARALRLVADRARARPARRRDRQGAAEAAPRPRDRLARPAPGDSSPRGRGGADPPGERAARKRVGAYRERVGRARPACLPGDQADGRDPRRQLHALPRPRARGELRPLDRRRGLGGRLLPAREPRAQVGRLRLADRLRRLAADGGRRRARDVPDHRLQRRDDRAHRPLPQDPRPGGIRRQPRRRRPQLVRATASRGSATGPSSTTTSPAT